MSSSPKLGKLLELYLEMVKKKLLLFSVVKILSDFYGSEKAGRAIYGFLKRFALFDQPTSPLFLLAPSAG